MARFKVEHRPRIIAPRLANGEKRVGFGHGLPPHIKEGLRRIAAKENKSMSWVMETVIIDYFSLRPPQYIPKKPVVPPGPPNSDVPKALTVKKSKEQPHA
jgi:hypothetical protein